MNKSILITGASTGIGAACVVQAANRDLNIIAVARSEDKLLKLQTQYNNVEIITADLSKPNDWQRISDYIKTPIDFNSITWVVFNFFMDNGVFLRPLGNTIYIQAPYVITKKQLDKVYTVIEDALEIV